MTSCNTAVDKQKVDKGDYGWAQVSQILKNIKAPQFPGREYNILDFGAIGEGITDCHPAFVKAISQCNQEGGGRVVVPRGVYFIKGPIQLKSNVNLYLEKESKIVFRACP